MVAFGLRLKAGSVRNSADSGDTSHAEVVVGPLFADEAALDHVGQAINAVSLTLNADGKGTLRERPREPITDAYKGRTP